MSENNNELNNPNCLKVEPKRPVIVRVVKKRPLKKKIEDSKHKASNDIVAGVRIGSSFAGGDFGSLDLSNTEILKGMFLKANLKGSDFSGSDLSGSNFERANLAGSDFSGAVLKNVNFKGADLTGVDFSNADLEGANLVGATIKDATICNTNLAGVKLTKTVREELQRIREAMKEIDLSKVDLRKIDLRYVDFKNVDLRGVDFTGVDLSGVNLVGVNLSGAKIDFSQIDGSRFLRSNGNNKVKISKGNLAGLDPLTVHQIQTKEAEQKKIKEGLEKEQSTQEQIVNERENIATKNPKRPPYKVKEEDYVKSKYDFPDIHSQIIERDEKQKEAEEKIKNKENIVSDNETETMSEDVSAPKKLGRFFPSRIKKGSKTKVRS